MRHDTPRYTADQAKRIGPCAVIAMAKVTGLSWDQVWEVAQYYFSRTGLTSIDKDAILRELGYESEGFYKLMHWDRMRDIDDDRCPRMTVVQAEKWLVANMPDAKLICQIDVDGSAHAIAFSGGRFHNTLGAKRSRINLAMLLTK
jgi:hypothetical protein